MTLTFLSALTFACAMLSSGVGPAAATQGDSPDISDSWVARRVQAALGIKPSGTDILAPLAEVISTFAGKDEAAKQAAVKALADALLKGAEPDALAKRLKQAARLDDYIGSPSNPQWQYGSYMDRFHVKMILATRSHLEQGRNPEQAARLAKAAMLLAAHEVGEPVLRVLRGKWETLLRIAQLDDAAKAELSGLLDQEQLATEEFVGLLEAVMQAHDRVFDLEPRQAIPQTMVEPYVAALQALVPAATTSARRLEAIHEAWQLKNFGVAHKTPEAVEAAEKLLREWRQKLAQDDIERAWIDDALARTGPRPTHRRITVLKEDDPRARQLGEPKK